MCDVARAFFGVDVIGMSRWRINILKKADVQSIELIETFGAGQSQSYSVLEPQLFVFANLHFALLAHRCNMRQMSAILQV